MEKEKLLSLDTALDGLIHRPPARRIARALVSTPLTPNQLTLLSLIPSLASGFFFYKSTFHPANAFLGVFFYYTWAVLDHADGELARLTHRTSPFGKKLDDCCDVISTNAIFLGIFFGMLPYWNLRDQNLLKLLFFIGLMLSFLSNLALAEAKIRARKRIIESRVIDPGFVKTQKRLDIMSGRDPIYAFFFPVILSFWVKMPWMMLTMGVYLSGLYAISFVSFWAALRTGREDFEATTF